MMPRQAQISEIVNDLKAELDRLSAAESLVVPAEPGGWWHQYVCPEHHTELIFDEYQADALQYRCPYGCVLEGAEYRGAWLVFKHQSLARAALQAAAVYSVLHEEADARLGKRLLVKYARQFPRYEVHPEAQDWMLKGRAFHQALTEAIWSTTLIRAYMKLRDEGVSFSVQEQQAIDHFMALLAESMEEYRHILIDERDDAKNNYTAWLNAALGCVYAARSERDAFEALIDGKGGFKHHLSIGVKPDQLEFEGSTYYHVFVLRAYMISAEMAERFGIDLYACVGAEGQSMKGMLEALVLLADDQGKLPALHEGPFERSPYACEIAEISAKGLRHYGLDSLAPILNESSRQLCSQGLGLLELLLYGSGLNLEALSACQQQRRESRLWPDSGFVVGRRMANPLSFLADFGEHGGAHGHYDKLHLTLMHETRTITPDFGTVPYGSAIRHSWYSQTMSHNTVSLNGESQAAHTGRCVTFEDTDAAVYVWLQSTDAYPGCRLDRHLLLTDDILLDWFHVSVSGCSAKCIEWWMHPVMEPVIQDCNASPGLLQSVYPVGHEGVYHSAWLFPGDELHTISTYGDSRDPGRRLTSLCHSHSGVSADFIHVYRADQAIRLQWTEREEMEINTGNRCIFVKRSDESGLAYETNKA